MKNICNELDNRVNGIFKLLTMISLGLMVVGFLISQEFVLFAGIGTVVVFGILAIYELLLIARNLEFVNLVENDLVKLTYHQIMKYIKLYYLVVVGFTIAVNSPLTVYNHSFGFIYRTGIGIYGAVALVIYMLLFELFVLKTNIIQIIIKYVLFVGFQFFTVILGVYALVLIPLIYVFLSINIMILGKQRGTKTNYINMYLFINIIFATIATSIITIKLGGTIYESYYFSSWDRIFRILIINVSSLIIMGYICRVMCGKFKASVKKQVYLVINFMIWLMPSVFIVQRLMDTWAFYEKPFRLEEVTLLIITIIINLIVAYIVTFRKNLNNIKVIDGVNNAYNKWFE